MLDPRSIPTPLVESRLSVALLAAPRAPRLPALSLLGRLLAWAAAVLWLRLSRRSDPAEYGRRFRVLLEHLGGLWIKLGQLLSLRADLFPVEFCRQLSLLQGNAVGFPTEEAIRIVEDELGPMASVFSEFDEIPIAAASIGQVYAARLRASGHRVAVKVQRPHLSRTFEEQLRVIRWIMRALRLARFRPHMRWDELTWELQEIMREELDCRYEASSTRRMRRTLRSHRIYAPKVFLATRRVLVTEFVDGVLMSDYLHVLRSDPRRLTAWLAENRIDPRRVGRRLALSLLRQLLEDNLYHGDLHPGNVMLLRDSRIALIDFGACSFIEREYQDRFRLSIYALATRDYAKAADLALILAGTMPPVDLDPIREQFVRAMREWAANTPIRERPYNEKSMATLYNALMRILYDHHCTMEWTLLRIRRAQETLDASLMHLIPDVDYSKTAAEYFRGASQRASRVSETAATLRAAAGAGDPFELQQRLAEYTFFQAGVVRRQVRVLSTAASETVELLSGAVTRFAVLLGVGTAVSLAVAVAQSSPKWLPFVTGANGAELARLVRPLDVQVWLIVVGAGACACIVMARLGRRLRADTPERAAAV